METDKIIKLAAAKRTANFKALQKSNKAFLALKASNEAIAKKMIVLKKENSDQKTHIAILELIIIAVLLFQIFTILNLFE